MSFRKGLLYQPRSSNEMRHVENQFPELKCGKNILLDMRPEMLSLLVSIERRKSTAVFQRVLRYQDHSGWISIYVSILIKTLCHENFQGVGFLHIKELNVCGAVSKSDRISSTKLGLKSYNND